MTSKRLILICLLFHIGNQSKAQTDDLKEKLSKTWVAKKEIIHVPMTGEAYPRSIQEFNKDSIIIKPDHTIERYTQNTLYHGKWKLSPDNTEVIFEIANCIDCYSMNMERLILNTLTDTTIEMRINHGKEGEWTQKMFKQSK